MHTQILIIGQGISGTMLSWFLHKANIPFRVIDHNASDTASKVAAGIINPVTGRRIVKTWMIDEIMPFAVKTYEEFGRQFGIDAIQQKDIIDFFPTQQMQDAFSERVLEQPDYLHRGSDLDFSAQLQYHLGYGIIRPGYIVNLQAIMHVWRNYLLEKHLLTEADVDVHQLNLQGSRFSYKDIQAEKIVFADGETGQHNPWFKRLPFATNKGEALIIDAPGLNENYIYKKGITLAPLGNHQFWVGASYTWDYSDNLPTTAFYENTKSQLGQLLKIPFRIVDHKAAIRPANLERRPFVGFHPLQPAVGIFNGMGAKGTSLAPFFADQLVSHISNHHPISPEASVSRFTKILSKS